MSKAGSTERIDVPGSGSVSARWSGPQGSDWAVIYAPGAGSNLNDAFGAYLSRQLEAEGIGCLRFQFPYSEAARSIPDRPPVLEATWRAALEAGRPRAKRIAIGGRSMGGRMASHIVAAGSEVDALALFAYPLHPPGRPANRRDAHLPQIAVPTLFCSGDRDTFGTIDELTEAAAIVPNARLHVLDGADHGFAVLKASGRKKEEIWHEAATALLNFLRSLP